MVFGLRLDTLRGTVESPKWYGMYSGFDSLYPDRRLTVLPDGRLGAVQLGRGDAGTFVVNVFSRNDGKRPVRRWVWEQERDVDLERGRSASGRSVRRTDSSSLQLSTETQQRLSPAPRLFGSPTTSADSALLRAHSPRSLRPREPGLRGAHAPALRARPLSL